MQACVPPREAGHDASVSDFLFFLIAPQIHVDPDRGIGGSLPLARLLVGTQYLSMDRVYRDANVPRMRHLYESRQR